MVLMSLMTCFQMILLSNDLQREDYHKNCEFIEVCNVCSLNYFSHCLLMDIDRHDCKKKNNKYRASTLKF